MKNRLLFFLLLIGLLITGTAQAQGAPLILWIRGDLYVAPSFDVAPTAITSDGTISGPALAPDGQHIAYKAAAQVGLDALDRVDASGFIADIDLPADIYVLNLSDGVSQPVATQPADASLFVDGTPDSATIRSTPVWSPDGMRLAWTEYDYPDGQPKLVAYDLASGASTTLAENIPAPLVQGAPPALKWGNGGIAINASSDSAGEQDYLFYNPNGARLSSPRLAAVVGDPVVDFVWIEGANQLGILYTSARWIFIDPTTGVAQAAQQLPKLTTTVANSLTLTFGSDSTKGFFWEIDGTNAAAAGSPTQVTLSPDGQQVAFIGFPSSGAVSIWRNGDAVAIPDTGSNLDELQVGMLLWGYTYWTV